MTYTFCVNDDVMCLAASLIVDDIVDELLLVIVIFLRKENVLSTVGDAAPQSDIACGTSHNLDDGASLMRGGCITDFVNSFHSCVNSCIETDCIFCAGNIKVDCARNTDYVDAFIGKLLSAAIGTVAADNYEAFDTHLVAYFDSSRDAFRCTHLFAASCSKDCAALLDCIGNIGCFHFLDIFFHEACVSSLDTIDLESSGQTVTYNGTDCRIHTRRIAAARQNTDSFNLFLSHFHCPLRSIFVHINIYNTVFTEKLCIFTYSF